jgi:peptidyl-prolyl cis-trans isomerase SurA
MTPKKRNRLFLILLAGCAVAAAAQQVVEEIVAIVNDEVITLSGYKKEYDLRLTQIKAQLKGEQQEKAIEQVKAQLLDAMITDALLLQLAKEKNLNVSDQLKMAIENIKKENNLESDDELQRALRSQGMQYDVWLKQREEDMLRQSVVYSEINKSIAVDEAEIIDYYKKHDAEFIVPEEYKVRAVYLAPDLRSAAETEARKAEILEKLKGGLPFDKTAEEFCDAPLKEAKGDLGTLKKGETDKTLFEALAPLKKGERTGWVEGKKGWYLLQVEDKKDSRTRTFDESKRDIEQKMFQERQAAKLDGFLKDLKKRNYIKILKPNPLG